MSDKELLATWPEAIWLQCCDEELHDYSVVESEVSWCVDKIHNFDVEYVRKDIADAAVLAEREACAAACDALHHTWRFDNEPDSCSGPRSCAAAIRNRKEMK